MSVDQSTCSDAKATLTGFGHSLSMQDCDKHSINSKTSMADSKISMADSKTKQGVEKRVMHPDRQRQRQLTSEEAGKAAK